MRDSSDHLRRRPQIRLAEVFQWSLVFAFWFAFCGIMPTTLPAAIGGIIVIGGLGLARYYWIRDDRMPWILRWSYYFFVLAAATLGSFVTLFLWPRSALLSNPDYRPGEDFWLFAVTWIMVLIVGHLANYTAATTLSLILVLFHRPWRRLATFLVGINLLFLLLLGLFFAWDYL